MESSSDGAAAREAFAAVLYEWRTRYAKMSLRALATATGISRTTLGAAESGRKIPGEQKLRTIGKALESECIGRNVDNAQNLGIVDSLLVAAGYRSATGGGSQSGGRSVDEARVEFDHLLNRYFGSDLGPALSRLADRWGAVNNDQERLVIGFVDVLTSQAGENRPRRRLTAVSESRAAYSASR